MEFASADQTASVDLKLAVARLDDIDYSLEIWGLGDQEEVVNWLEATEDLDPLFLGNFSGSSFSGDIDLGTIITASDDKGYLAVVNWGKKELIINEDPNSNDVEKVDLPSGSDPATILPDFDNPVLFDMDDDAYLTPASAMMLKTNKSISEYYPDPIRLVYDAGTINLVYSWAVALVDDENTLVGVTQGVDPSDLSGISTGIDTVLDYDAISGEVDPDNDFNILFAPDGEGIAEFSLNTANPASGTGGVCALPMVVEFAITGDMVDAYNSDLAEAMELSLGEDPTEADVLQVIKDSLFFEKDWGSTQERISLNNNAVEVRIEEDEEANETFIIFRLYLVMVDGGTAGVTENVEIDGQNYLVIYDGVEDGTFFDPIRLLGDESGSGTATSSGSSGGCALGFLTPIAMLLIAPLLVLLKK